VYTQKLYIYIYLICLSVSLQWSSPLITTSLWPSHSSPPSGGVQVHQSLPVLNRLQSSKQGALLVMGKFQPAFGTKIQRVVRCAELWSCGPDLLRIEVESEWILSQLWTIIPKSFPTGHVPTSKRNGTVFRSRPWPTHHPKVYFWIYHDIPLCEML